MPITYTIDKQRRFIQRVLSETVTTDEILANITEILDHPDYQLGMKSLTDLQALQHHATPQDVRQIAHFILGHGEQVQGGRAAVVVAEDVGFGMARMLELLTEDSPLAIGVFKNRKEAYDWLGIETD
jgi:hypothetical protein